ncbi:MAG TPA: response regulator transcription factor [Rubricoccaceae bacterium]|nr:response regulator transcription factor [Rubricoccaceae bacterium]
MAGRIYIIEDHPLIRQVVTELIEETEGLEVAGVASTAEEALEALAASAADLVLIDMSLPRMNGSELASEVLARWPGLRCVMLSGHTGAPYVKRALDAGVRGYVVKGDPEELVEAIRRVLGGEVYLSEPVRNLV